MDTLVSLKVFNTVATTKSFVLAAEKLGISAAMATKHLQNIEARIGARLLNRTSRKVSLTEAGDIYLLRVRPLLEGLAEAEEIVSDSTLTPRGTLKLSLPVWMATPSFIKQLAVYSETYKEVKLQLDLSGNFVNLIEESYDLVLRVGDSSGDGLIARKLADVQFVAVASPDFIRRYGNPKVIEDLNDIPFLAYTRVSTGTRLRYQDKDTEWAFDIDPVLKSENETLILLAAIEGMGAAILPVSFVSEHLESGQLDLILPEIIGAAAPLFALYPDRNYLPAKTRSFIDFMLSPNIFSGT